MKAAIVPVVDHPIYPDVPGSRSKVESRLQPSILKLQNSAGIDNGVHFMSYEPNSLV